MGAGGPQLLGDAMRSAPGVSQVATREHGIVMAVRPRQKCDFTLCWLERGGIALSKDTNRDSDHGIMARSLSEK